jgi:acetyl-CoA C-acetyltransferase
MHSVATMADRLRDEPSAVGLCTANGGYVTKHAFGVYSATPPASGRFEHREPQAEVDALPRRELDTEHAGAVTVETYTVMHDRDGRPERALAACLTPAGARTWGHLTDDASMKAMTAEELVGRPGQIGPDGDLELTG